MRKGLLLLTAFLPALAAAGAAAAPPSGYAGEQGRAVKALSEQEIDDLLGGRGAGFALTAELNHYPGPSHSLDLGADLDLTQVQRGALTAIRARMAAAAKPLGAAIVGRERDLDGAFAAATITVDTVRRLTGEIGALRGRLRAVHLAAHLETRAVLTPEQVAAYDRLRGYAAAPSAAPSGHHSGG